MSAQTPVAPVPVAPTVTRSRVGVRRVGGRRLARRVGINLLALLVNDSNLPSDTSWSFIARHYPGAVVDLIRANAGFLRDGEWYTALYFLGAGLSLALCLIWLRRRDPVTLLMAAGAVLSVLYVVAAPAFSAFRLELAFVPMAAYAIALATEAVVARIAGRAPAAEHVAVGSPRP